MNKLDLDQFNFFKSLVLYKHNKDKNKKEGKKYVKTIEL